MASNLTGDYAVAIQIEDFMSPTDIDALSSVPLQFIVRVQDFSPIHLATANQSLLALLHRTGHVLVHVPFNTSWNARIIARVSNTSRAITITDFVTGSPFGLMKSNLVSVNPGEWQVSVTWTPNEYQYGLNIFCYAALDNLG